ncbi:unnamed protein product [Vicia faba]|uniref:Uncharacterized protein n=1 Tax=Vicia faba TaxID=3906 RepID=A0AAV0YP69_VICFA|nr:unnamed protein product [Vicia faba]
MIQNINNWLIPKLYINNLIVIFSASQKRKSKEQRPNRRFSKSKSGCKESLLKIASGCNRFSKSFQISSPLSLCNSHFSCCNTQSESLSNAHSVCLSSSPSWILNSDC